MCRAVESSAPSGLRTPRLLHTNFARPASTRSSRRSHVALRVTCPICGSRPYTEYWFGGELVPRPAPGDGARQDYERVWLKQNISGRQHERWFHHAGCRRWFTVERDTTTNEIHGVA